MNRPIVWGNGRACRLYWVPRGGRMRPISGREFDDVIREAFRDHRARIIKAQRAILFCLLVRRIDLTLGVELGFRPPGSRPGPPGYVA